MRCTVCGGEVILQNNLYVCEHCGNKQQVSASFENFEVFICYIENDNQGRRTRDSVIAQDIYNKLNAAGVNTFYQRISASNLTGTEYNNICEAALNNSKIALFIGASKQSFETLADKYSSILNTKKIIPVYSVISAYDIPSALSGLQAMNYDNIGAAASLPKTVLTILGRADEIDSAMRQNREKSRKKTIALSSVITAILIIAAIGAYFVFGTAYVLKSKKYERAEHLFEDGNYIESLDAFSRLGDYRNSGDMVKRIYDKYAGYYNSEDKRYSFSFNVSDKNKVQIDAVYVSKDKKQIKFSAQGVINSDTVSCSFVDTQKNEGICKTSLSDDGIEFSITTESKNSKSVIKDGKYRFKLTDKADAPEISVISKDTVIGWLKNGVSKDTLLKNGFELELLSPYTVEGITLSNTYAIVNTDIKIEIDAEAEKALSMLVPAHIILPDKIGKEFDFLYEDSILYMPNGELYDGIYGDIKKVNLAPDTPIAVTSDKMLYSVNMQLLSIAIDRLISDCKTRGFNVFDGRPEYIPFICIRDNDSYILAYEADNSVFYKVRKRDLDVTFLCTLPRYAVDIDYDTSQFTNIAEFPQYFGEFITAQDRKAIATPAPTPYEPTPTPYEPTPTERSSNTSSSSSKRDTETAEYRVRKSASDQSSQIGAFADFERAKMLATERRREGYKVYDSNGSLVFSP